MGKGHPHALRAGRTRQDRDEAGGSGKAGKEAIGAKCKNPGVWLKRRGPLFGSFAARKAIAAQRALTNYCMVHLLKSIGLWHLPQVCCLSNSSEKISFSAPHSGHLQIKDFRLLFCSNPGQCFGVVISSSHILAFPGAQGAVSPAAKGRLHPRCFGAPSGSNSPATAPP